MTSPHKRKAPDRIEDFVPKKKVLVQINKTNLYMYPNVTPGMGNNERSLVFNFNKTALVNARSISFNQKLNHMGELLGYSNIIDIKRNVFKNTAFDFLKINTNLIALSYHNAQGGIINNAFDAAGNLKPVQDSGVNACRPDGISFCKVRATINLTNLDPSITPIPTSFFLRLPVNDRVVANAADNNRTLHTFDGPAAWLTGDQAKFTTLIYSHADTVHEPFNLVAPDFTTPEAIIDIESRVNKIEEDISKASWNTLLSKILRQVCPNFLNDPYKTLNRVRQNATIGGNSITQTVRQYHDQIQLVISTSFDKSLPSWPANPFRTFMDNLSPEIKNKVEQNNFCLHTQTVSTTPHGQANLIQEGYEAANLAEKELAENRNCIRNEPSSALGFISIPGLPPSLPTAPMPNCRPHRRPVRSFMSPAETTIQAKATPACAGCGDPGHMYYDKRSKTILCPKQDQLEVQAQANTWLQDFRAHAKQRRADTSRSTKAFGSQILAQLQQGEGDINFNKHEHIVLINTSLPHIKLQLGAANTDFQPCIPVIVDSGSCLCTANSDYIMAIAKAYPQLVKSITLATDRYAPILPSGIVSDEEEQHNFSTSLPCVVEFHMPYMTNAGSPTSLKVACSKQVGVNALIGMSFMTAAKLVVDLNDNIIKSKLLSCDPFPIIYKRPQRSMPNLVPIIGNRSKKCLEVINPIETEDAFINKAVIINKATIATTPFKRVAEVITANSPEVTFDRVV
jgi:hypothetical protein